MSLTALHRFGKEDLNPREQIIYRARLYFIAFLINSKKWIFIMSFSLGLLFLAFLYGDTIGFLQDDVITFGVSVILGSFFLFASYEFLIFFLDWLYDEGIITNQRVIDYNQKFLFSRDLSTANMISIEDIILYQDGFIRTFFNYGTLDIQTAASGTHASPGQKGLFLILHDIHRPRNIQRLIDEVAYRVKKGLTIDPEEILLICGLKKGNLDEYFVVKKTRGWKKKVKKLLRWK